MSRSGDGPLGRHLADRGVEVLLRRRSWWKWWTRTRDRRHYDRIQQAREELARRGQMFAPFGRSTLWCFAGPRNGEWYTDPRIECTRCGSAWNLWITTEDPIELVRAVTEAGRHHQLLCRKDNPDG